MRYLTVSTLILTVGLGLSSCGSSEPLPPAPSAWKTASEKSAAGAPAAAPGAKSAPAAKPAAAAPATAAAPAPAKRYAPREPLKVTLPAGTTVAVRMGQTLTSEQSNTGDSWTGTLAEPLLIDGMVIAEKGATVTGKVVDAKRAGKVKGVAELDIALTGFHTADDQDIAVTTSAFGARGSDDTKKDTAKVAIASGIGAAIGAIAGKGKGAAIGAGAGAAAGTGAVLVTRGGPAVIPVESVVRFRTTNAVTITEKILQ